MKNWALLLAVLVVGCSSSSGDSNANGDGGSGGSSSGGNPSGDIDATVPSDSGSSGQVPHEAGGGTGGGRDGEAQDSGNGDAGHGGDASDGGKLPLGSPCDNDNQCAGGACVDFPAVGGKRCTEKCPKNPADCPNGGLGCNKQGFCKVP